MVCSEPKEEEVRYTLVAIDTSGKWWRGDSPTDIEDYLRAYTSDTYAVVHYRACVCSCGSVEFRMETDSADQGRVKAR
jgi:hypothetical protein